MTITDTVNGFVLQATTPPEPPAAGVLAGLTFAVKDLFDLAGVPTGAGSPDWRATHEVPTATAPVVQRLLDAGAQCLGKTHTDELAWSLNGENAHYGTPVNVAAPGRIPGGSSSGSAAVTAAGLVSFAVGSDTGGSVRLPASYCGLFGIRPTYGAIPIAGAVPLAPSYDTVGWFARDAATLALVGGVLLPPAEVGQGASRVLLATDLFAAAGEAVTAALAPALAAVQAVLGPLPPVEVAGPALASWREAFRLIQSSEAWAKHGAWIRAVRPGFGPGVRERFAAAEHLAPAEVEAALRLRAQVRDRMASLLLPGTVLVAPSAPGIAPLRGTPAAELDTFRARALEILCPAGHAGLPQISLPLGRLDGCPLGLSLIGAAGEDRALLAIAGRIAAAHAGMR